jgi:Tfp pilus assembly protein PilW
MVVSIKQLKVRGFTLVEMILYVSICSALLLSLSAVFAYLLESRVKSQAITEVNQQGFFVMNIITSTVRNAKSVDVPLIGNTSTSLSVTTQSSILSPTVFSLSSSTLVVIEAGGVSVPLTNSRLTVGSLLFENVSSASSTDTIIRVSYTLSYKSGSLKHEYAYTKSFVGSATLR